MNSKAAALRSHVESVLAGRLANPFEFHAPQPGETIPFGVSSLDALTGGLPRGGLTEIYGPSCTGGGGVLNCVLASRTAAMEVCALVDASDCFDPGFAEAAGVRLKQLLWVRCRNADQALRATDLLTQAGGFGVIALDLSGIAPRVSRSVPLPVWFRFRRSVEHTPTVLLVMSQESNAKSCASLVLRLDRQQTSWLQTGECPEGIAGPHAPGLLLDGWSSSAEMIRSRGKRPQVHAADSEKRTHAKIISLDVCEDRADFFIQASLLWQASWNSSRSLPARKTSGARHKKK